MSVFKTDWLASNSVFYHELTKKISTNINEVIDFESFEWDLEGLANYLEFGYVVFGQTPLKYVKFLPPNAEIYLEDNNLIIKKLKDKDDNILASLSTHSSPSEVLDLISARINDWQKNHQGDTILPLSGGLDSRLLLQFLPERNRIKSFTYGVGSKQEDSWEVIHAQYLAKKFGVQWQQILLGDFMLLSEEWYANFGISTHLHGMYQMEFYKKIRAQNQGDSALLSGMVGDAWAGSIFSNSVLHPKDIAKLGYAHGLAAEPKYLKEKPKYNHVKIDYFESKQAYISHPLFSVVETIRTKNMLLKYLLQVPEKLGFKPYAPFIEEDIALAMLRLPDEQRKNRKWQRDYFDKLNLNLEVLPLKRSYLNDIDQYAVLRNPIEPLSTALLGEIIDENYVYQINNNVLNSFQSKMEYKLFKHLGTTKGFRRFLKDKFAPNYAAYTILYPLQKLIIARNEYFKKP